MTINWKYEKGEIKEFELSVSNWEYYCMCITFMIFPSRSRMRNEISLVNGFTYVLLIN